MGDWHGPAVIEASRLCARAGTRRTAPSSAVQGRRRAHGIYPPLLESDGLASALEDIADQSALPVTIESDGADRFSAAIEAAVYFCCLEALQNAAKHGGPGTCATIHLGKDEGDLHFAVTDDGCGYDVRSRGTSTGMQNMTDRIGALGGRICVTSAPGAGTKVEGWVPIGVAARLVN